MSVELVADVLSLVAMLVGLFFMFVGALGVFRLPDTYLRLHAASKTATLGLLGLLLSAVLYLGTVPVLAKASITILFAFVALPVGSHLLAKAAHADQAPKWPGTLSDDLEEDRNRPST